MKLIAKKPICDKCGREVDHYQEDYQDFLQRLRVTVRCHGESEHVDLSDYELERVREFGPGRAFVQPKLLNAGEVRGG